MTRALPPGIRRKQTLGGEIDKVINAESSGFVRFVVIGTGIAAALWAIVFGWKP